jgi:hypothetical protein
MGHIIGKGRYAAETYPTRRGGGVAANLDQDIALGLQNDVSDPAIVPGDYYVFGELVFALATGATFVGVADPNAAIGPVFFGPEVLPGRIGQARVARAFDPLTTGSDDVDLQWTVDGVATGNVVTVPWDQYATLGTLTFAQSLAIAAGTPVDFGVVTWNAGQVLLLRATFGNVIGSGNAYIATTFDKLY